MASISIKRALGWVADMLGYEVIPGWRMPELSHAQRLRRIFEYYSVSTVLDVGANAGQFHRFLRLHVGFSGVIHSFEPVSTLASQMEGERRDDINWHIHNIALGRDEETKTINIMASTLLTSFREPEPGLSGFFGLKNVVERTEEVSVRTLDAIALSLDLDLARTFVKIDTQGWDIEVAEGGRKMLSQVAGIQTEVSVHPLYEGMPNLGESLSFFGGLGFRVADFFLVAEDDQLRAMEFDCLMVKDTADKI